MKLNKIFQEPMQLDNSEPVYYVGHFINERYRELVEQAELAGVASEFCAMPIAPDHYYLSESAIETFNQSEAFKTSDVAERKRSEDDAYIS